MADSYQLINPYIEGQMSTRVTSKSPFRAGKSLYQSLSTHFNNPVEQFYITIRNERTNDLHHFRIDEVMDGDDEVTFSLRPLEGHFDDDINAGLVNRVTGMHGGRHRRRYRDDSDSSDSSDSDSDCDRDLYSYPIQRMVYFALPYPRIQNIGMTALDQARLCYLPMCNFAVNPSLEISLDFYR